MVGNSWTLFVLEFSKGAKIIFFNIFQNRIFLHKHILPNSRSNQNKNQIKPKIWRGSIFGWLVVCHDHQNSSDVTLAFEDAD